MSKKTFNINNSLYSPPIIGEAILLFRGYDIVLENGVISIDDENPQGVFDELMNYALSISSENTLGASL